MMYVKLVSKKEITGKKSVYPAYEGGVISLKLLPEIDMAPEGQSVFPLYLVDKDEDYHDFSLDMDTPLEVQPVIHSEVTSFRALLGHTLRQQKEIVQFVQEDEYGVVDVPCYVLQVDQTEEAERQADTA